MQEMKPHLQPLSEIPKEIEFAYRRGLTSR